MEVLCGDAFAMTLECNNSRPSEWVQYDWAETFVLVFVHENKTKREREKKRNATEQL